MLDECREVDRRRVVALLCQLYKEDVKNTSAHGWLKFVITGRPYDDVQDSFGQIPDLLPSIRLRGEDENDKIHQEIDLVVRQRVAELARDLKLMLETKERIEQKLLHMDCRTYLWLHLAIDGLRTAFRDSLRPHQESIDSLPHSVEESYEQILGRVMRNIMLRYMDVLSTIDTNGLARNGSGSVTSTFSTYSLRVGTADRRAVARLRWLIGRLGQLAG